MYVQTLNLEAGLSDKGWDYAKWYLGVTSLHISNKNLARSSTLHQDAVKTGFGNSYVWTSLFIFVQCMPTPPHIICFLSDCTNNRILGQIRSQERWSFCIFGGEKKGQKNYLVWYRCTKYILLQEPDV